MNRQWVDLKSLSELKRGDIVRDKGSWTSYVVDSNYGEHVTAVKTADVTNPSEWEVIRESDS